MIRLLAVAGYVYQSLVAIALIFAISHLLPAADYTNFSLVLASGQLLCVLMFEWLQLAGLRFLAAARGAEAARLRTSLLTAGLLSAITLVAIGSGASLLSSLAPHLVRIGLGIAVLQGVSDLYFMTVRLSDRLGVASMLMALRTTALLVGAVTGALVAGTAQATLLGVAAGHATALLVGVIVHRITLQAVSPQTMLTHWREFCSYGMLVAGAAVIHISVPLMIRFIVIRSLGATGAGAGFSIAIDLLQRPFGVLNAAIHTVSYPDVVQDFEHGSNQSSRRSTGRMFDFMICATLVLLGGLIGFIPDVARLLVPQQSLDGFLATAPIVALFYFLHTHLQATVAVVPHLEKRALRLVIVAAGQTASIVAASAIASVLGVTPTGIVACASVATALVILLALVPTIQFRAALRWPLAIEAAMAATLIGLLALLPSLSPYWLAGKIFLAAAAVAIVAWRGDFLMHMHSDCDPVR
jgi:O-antigen/teichoic acid export membrane protein